MRSYFLPAILIALGLLSLLTLQSVAPGLVGRQFIFFLLGFGIFAGVSRVPYQTAQRLALPAYVGLLVLLCVPLLIGSITRGIAGWIHVGNLFSIQPSQLAIPFVSLLLADWATRLEYPPLQRFLTLLGIIGIPAALIFVQPDLGTTIIFLFSSGVIVWLSRIPLKYIGTVAGLGLVAVVLAWYFVLADFQKKRVTSFLSGNQDTQGSGYNARQSLIAVGSGQLMGRGIGQGVQSHLRFLPERQTDFIFASLAEELGFLGSITVVILYTGLVSYCIRTAVRTRNPAAQLYLFAAASMTVAQAGVNIGMNMSLLPITGITLPFVSYGGSSILAVSLMFGIVQSVAFDAQKKAVVHLE